MKTKSYIQAICVVILLITAGFLSVLILSEFEYQYFTNHNNTVSETQNELVDQIPPELRDRAILISPDSFGILGPLTEDELKLLDEYPKEDDRTGLFHPKASGEITTYCSEKGNLTLKTYIYGEKPILSPLQIQSKGYTIAIFEPARGYSFQNLEVGTAVYAKGIGISWSEFSEMNILSTSTTGFSQSFIFPENVSYAKLGYEGFNVTGLTGRPVIDQTGSASVSFEDSVYSVMNKVAVW